MIIDASFEAAAKVLPVCIEVQALGMPLHGWRTWQVTGHYPE
ncbi:hypothetical protein [Acidovorax sp. K2F]|nr:hypothetical protein [Acidovorax sp. K2F]MCT6720525.1 hypothetical protein [Acidovorax sp. K2F]